MLSADGIGTMAIMRRTGQSKPMAWRWQARFATEGVAGPLRDKTRPPGTKPLAAAVVRRVVSKLPAVKEWLAQQLRFYPHFTPTSSS